MAEHQSEREARLAKLVQYRELFGDPFPASTQRNTTVERFVQTFNTLGDASVVLAGRIRFWRSHGKLTFAHIEDATGRVQIVLSEDELGDRYKQLDLYDMGDIVEVTGKAFTTHKGEQSVLASEIRLLTKAVEPLPDKYHGLQDEEVRFRRRYVDMIMRPELRELFMRKAKFWQSMRSFLMEEGFLEVETPVLEATPGGADAEPFHTHHNALDIDLFLRISMGELWQKRLMVAGFEKTFEIGRQFRNEGLSPEHLQDYTQMEFYWAFADFRSGMKLVERMYKHVIQETYHTLQFTIKGQEVNFDATWPEIDYISTVNAKFGIDALTATLEELRAVCTTHDVRFEDGDGRGRLIDSLWKVCRKEIVGPAFLVNHPVEVSPLAKRQLDNPQLVQRFQVLIAGSEQGNGYSELNDPIDQRERFEQQARLREAGDVEAQMHDQEFVEALEIGMPPTCGFGVSERLFSFLEDKPIRECVMFPLMRPKSAVHEQPSVSKSATEPIQENSTPDITMDEFDAGISREAAKQLVFDKVPDPALRKHMLATEAQMKAFAVHLGAKNPEAWGIAGLLHDVDYAVASPEEHGPMGSEWLKQLGVHEVIYNAVHEHNTTLGIAAHSQMSKVMQCLEQLTGFIMAVTFVRPDKSIAEVKVSSVKKKLKDKGFAKGVQREWIMACEDHCGIPLDIAIELTLSAMQGIAAELELE